METCDYCMPHVHYHKHRIIRDCRRCHTFTFLNSCCHICTVFLSHSLYTVRFHLPRVSYLNTLFHSVTRRRCNFLYCNSKSGFGRRRYVKPKRNLTLVLCVTSPALSVNRVSEETHIYIHDDHALIYTNSFNFTHCTFCCNETTIHRTPHSFNVTYREL